MDIRKLQKAVVAALEDIKARDIEVYDVRHLTSFFDRVVVASADSTRQTKALVNHLRDRARDAGASIVGVEGEDSGEWVLVDLGDIIVHIMQPAVRSHYNLEELWNQPKPRAPRKAAARASTAK
jgi:ribosome-associated protein